MRTFVFPSNTQSTIPQHVVTDADIDPFLLAMPPPQQMRPQSLLSPLGSIQAAQSSAPQSNFSEMPPPQTRPLSQPPPLSPHLQPSPSAPHFSFSEMPMRPLPQPPPLPLPPSAPIQTPEPGLSSRGNHSITPSQITPLQTRGTSSVQDRPSPPPQDLQPNSAVANNHSWAGRNPSRPIIEPRPPKPKLTDAQKASRAIACQQKQACMQKLDDDIKAHVEEQARKISVLAAAHNTSVERIKGMVGVHTYYKKSRKPALHNALLHAQAERVNQDLPVGEKASLSELQSMIKDDDTVEDLTKEQQDILINKLVEHRQHKTQGMRANNVAAARDMTATSDAVIKEFDNLALRTGSYGFFFLTRGHVNDTGAPTYYGSDNAMDFLEDVLNLDPDEVCRLFEQWACSRHQNIRERDSLQVVRRQCTRMVQTGLRSSLGNKKVKMNYVNYDTAIVRDLERRLVGWPADVKFANPSEIGTVGEIRKLRDCLKSGQCHWIKLTRSQLDEHNADLQTRREAGQTIGKPRKKRSDAGTSRKRKQPSENQENEEPEAGPSRKRARKSKGKQKSVAVIESSDDDDSDSE